MLVVINSILLIALFAILGLSADLVVRNIKYIASSLKLSFFVMGILLGIITNLPELSVGINATVEGEASLSVGNILGGIIVVLGLIMGASVIFNRKIKSDSNLKSLIPIALVVFSPYLLGLKGYYGFWDGFIMIALYLGLLFYLYRIHHLPNRQIILIERQKIAKAVFLSAIGIVIVMLSSHWIVEITLSLFAGAGISNLVVGLLIFSIGTNLPEISIALTAWKRKAATLSLSHLTSSALSHVLVLGLLASLRPIHFMVGAPYYALLFFVFILLIMFVCFSRSDRKLDRQEGIALFSIYLFFVASNIFLIGF